MQFDNYSQGERLSQSEEKDFLIDTDPNFCTELPDTDAILLMKTKKF